MAMVILIWALIFYKSYQYFYYIFLKNLNSASISKFIVLR